MNNIPSIIQDVPLSKQNPPPRKGDETKANIPAHENSTATKKRKIDDISNGTNPIDLTLNNSTQSSVPYRTLKQTKTSENNQHEEQGSIHLNFQELNKQKTIPLPQMSNLSATTQQNQKNDDDRNLTAYKEHLAKTIQLIGTLKEENMNHDIAFLRRVTSVICCGAGGYGTVDLAYDRIESIALIKKKIEKKEDRENELRILKKLKEVGNPKLLKIVEAYEREGDYIILMEFGFVTLDKIIKVMTERKIELKKEDLMNICKQLLDQLEELKKIKIIHRDIKADNVIFTKNGDLKLIDFGKSVFENEEVHGRHKTNKARRQKTDKDLLKEMIQKIMKTVDPQGNVDEFIANSQHFEPKRLDFFFKEIYDFQAFEFLKKLEIADDFEKIETVQEFFDYPEFAEFLKEDLRKVNSLDDLIPLFIFCGKAFKKNGKYMKAKECYDELDNLIRKKIVKLEEKQEAWFCSFKAELLLDMKSELKVAEEYCKRSLELKKECYKTQRFEIALEYERLGSIKKLQFDHGSAIKNYQDAHDRIKDYPDQTNAILRITLEGHIQMHPFLQDEQPPLEVVEESIPKLQKLVNQAKQAFGERNKYYAETLSNMGLALLYGKKEYAAALSYFDQSLGVLEDLYGLNNLTMVEVLNYKCELQRKAGNLNEALNTSNQAFTILKAEEEPDYPRLLFMKYKRSKILKQCGRLKEALSLLDDCIKIHEAHDLGYVMEMMKLLSKRSEIIYKIKGSKERTTESVKEFCYDILSHCKLDYEASSSLMDIINLVQRGPDRSSLYRTTIEHEEYDDEIDEGSEYEEYDDYTEDNESSKSSEYGDDVEFY